MLRFTIALSLLAVAALFAFRRGGTPEKQVAGILLAIQALDIFYHALGARSRYLEVDYFHLLNDSWALVAMLYVALTANRFWPLWLAGFQLVAWCAHYVRLTDMTVHPMVYAIMIRLPFWLQMVTLVLGTWTYTRRSRQRAGSSI